MTENTSTTTGRPDANLAAMIRRAAGEHPDVAAPDVLARHVMAAITPGRERAFLASLLPRFPVSARGTSPAGPAVRGRPQGPPK